jgi:hypothetical protein
MVGAFMLGELGDFVLTVGAFVLGELGDFVLTVGAFVLGELGGEILGTLVEGCGSFVDLGPFIPSALCARACLVTSFLTIGAGNLNFEQSQ